MNTNKRDTIDALLTCILAFIERHQDLMNKDDLGKYPTILAFKRIHSLVSTLKRLEDMEND